MKKVLIIFFTITLSLSAHAADLTDRFMSNLNSYLSDKFPTAEIGLSTGVTNEVTGSILVVKPLTDLNDNENIMFTQGSLFLSDNNRETINLGFGNRKLINDDKLLVGANLFYDYELDYGHQRASVGIEAISSVGSFRFNQYYGLSGWKTGLDSIKEKALNGDDVELGMPLPYMPWTNLYFRSFNWEGASGAADQKGDELSLEAKLSNFNIEVGKRSHDGTTEDEEFIRLTWTCCSNSNNELGLSDTAYNLTSVADQKFAKVRRQNLIVKQKEMSLTVIGF